MFDAETLRNGVENDRGPVMGSSAGSNRTFAFDESTGILSVLPPRILRVRRMPQRDHRPGQRQTRDTAAPSSGGDDGGSGAVHYQRTRHGTSSSSTSSGASTASDDPADGCAEARGRAGLAVPDGHSPPPPPLVASPLPPFTPSIAGHPRPAVATASQVSSDTEYAPPSEVEDADGAGRPPVLPLQASAVAPPPLAPPVGALQARGSPQEHLDRASRGERHHVQLPQRGASATGTPSSPPPPPPPHSRRTPARSEAEERKGAPSPSTSPSSASSQGGAASGKSGSSTPTASTTTSTTSSDSDDDDDGDASLAPAFSKLSRQSEAPSSRMRHDNAGGLHAHPSLTHGGATYFATAVRDVRSSLVSTLDVDVAVVQRRSRQRQHDLYLHSTLHPCLPPGVAPTPAAPSPPLPSLKQRADAGYRRHMDALVEHYLSAPKYRTALSQFRKHLPLEEQRLRSADVRRRYAHATEARQQSWAGAADADAQLPRERRDGDDRGAPSAQTAVSSGVEHYRLEKTDVELFAGDIARRARLLDDTLPWRPIDFDDVSIRLEPLEHQQTDLTAMDALAASGSGGGGGGGGGGATVALGGSVSLLVEVLILTEMDVPFTSTIPAVNYTNVFLLLASLFVQAEVLLTKLIRLYRSVRVWEADVEDASRAAYLEQRILQCILAYCRIHEADLTLSCLQRLANLAASEGYHSPADALHDALGKEDWPCGEGAQSAARRKAAAWAAASAMSAVAAATPTSTSASAMSPTAGAVRHLKRYSLYDPQRVAAFAADTAAPQRGSTAPSGFPVVPNTAAARVPLQHGVAHTMLELTVYLQRTAALYYRPVGVSEACAQAMLPVRLDGPRRLFLDAGVLRPSLGCAYSSLRTAMAADPHWGHDAAAALAALSHGSGGSGSGAYTASVAASAAGQNSPPPSLWQASMRLPNPYHASPAEAGSGAAAGQDGQAARPRHRPTLAVPGAILSEAPLAAVDVEAEHMSRQLSLLSFSLFAAVHIRELLNNAWTDAVVKHGVAARLTELMDFAARLQRWIAAVIVTPPTWAECQRGLRYFLEVCRMLYEQQNYEIASAVLDGLRHPAVEVAERAFEEAQGQRLLTPAERRELETLQELMDPFASYSPSSLYSVAARTLGDMETPMIPLLSPILGVIFRSEEAKGPTITVRGSDGQAVVNWSKLTSLGKMLVLWMRCQHTPYSFRVDPEMQEYLWSTTFHQWTDAHLLRAARRTKR
ncbi:RasGEF domain containing protein [Novymonas esmeraldas]|uniref:RasGEF domain containing protein n=1 Tax=Novymonas esmeraldas TaxID=1808958 RepID=A0AAW0EMP3_9TRYP